MTPSIWDLNKLCTNVGVLFFLSCNVMLCKLNMHNPFTDMKYLAKVSDTPNRTYIIHKVITSYLVHVNYNNFAYSNLMLYYTYCPPQNRTYFISTNSHTNRGAPQKLTTIDRLAVRSDAQTSASNIVSCIFHISYTFVFYSIVCVCVMYICIRVVFGQPSAVRLAYARC